VSFDFAAEGIDIPTSASGPEDEDRLPEVQPHPQEGHPEVPERQPGRRHLELLALRLDRQGAGRPRGRQRACADKPKAYVRPEVKAAGLTAAALGWFAGRGITPRCSSATK
jgi:hypothetical protein